MDVECELLLNRFPAEVKFGPEAAGDELSSPLLPGFLPK